MCIVTILHDIVQYLQNDIWKKNVKLATLAESTKQFKTKQIAGLNYR